MEAETANNKAGEKTKQQRSASYPGFTVNDSFDFASKINENFSVVAEVTREEIAHVLGLHPNTVARDIAACVQFGFLNKIEGRYKLTDLFSDIFRPESEKDKKINLITAFGKPKLYADLISKFDGHVIPAELANTLIKHHDITESASQAAAETFIKSGEQVGVIGENRVLKYSVTLSALSKTQYAEIITETLNASKENNVPAKIDTFNFEPVPPPAKQKMVPIYLTNNKIAQFIYPDDITEGDIAIVKHQLEGVLLRIKIENEEKERLRKEEEKLKGETSPS